MGGKLDPHVTIYSFEKIMASIAAGGHSADAFGIPVLSLDSVMEAQVEVGLGPLHTVFDDKGYAYTSLFLDSAVARWTLGGPYDDLNDDEPWTLVQKLPVHYNIGHITAAEGDTASPDGQYVVALNKWSIDRFANVGPLLPQNFQLVDVSQAGRPDAAAVRHAHRHGRTALRADHQGRQTATRSRSTPRSAGTPTPWPCDPERITSESEARVERNGNTVEIWMTVARSHFTPERVEIREGDHVIWHLTNIETHPRRHARVRPVGLQHQPEPRAG